MRHENRSDRLGDDLRGRPQVLQLLDQNEEDLAGRGIASVVLLELLLDVVDPVALLHLAGEELIVRRREEEDPTDLTEVQADGIVVPLADLGAELGQTPASAGGRGRRPLALGSGLAAGFALLLVLEQRLDVDRGGGGELEGRLRDLLRLLGRFQALGARAPGGRALRSGGGLGGLLGAGLGALRQVDRALARRHRELVDG